MFTFAWSFRYSRHRLLMKAQNISWREHKTKAEIYDGIPQISSILAQRWARFAGHCYRYKDQIISDVSCMRFPRTSRGRRPFNYIDCIARDINQDITDLPNLMADRVSWQSIVNSFSDASAWWWWWGIITAVANRTFRSLFHDFLPSLSAQLVLVAYFLQTCFHT